MDLINCFFNFDFVGGVLLDIGVYVLVFVEEFLIVKLYIIGIIMYWFSSGVDEFLIIMLWNVNDELVIVVLMFWVKMFKCGIVVYENGYFIVDIYLCVDSVIFIDSEGYIEIIIVGDSINVMNYEIVDM